MAKIGLMLAASRGGNDKAQDDDTAARVGYYLPSDPRRARPLGSLQHHGTAGRAVALGAVRDGSGRPLPRADRGAS